MRRISLLYFYVVFGMLLSYAAADAKTFFVKPTGNDLNPGTTEKPIVSLQEAAKRVREYRRSSEFIAKPEPITIVLQSGIWFLTEPLVLTFEDSGTESAPITWQAECFENPNVGPSVLSGGLVVTGWKRMEGEPNIWSAPIPIKLLNLWEENFEQFGSVGTQLFVNNRRAVRARTPNLTLDRSSSKEHFYCSRVNLNKQEEGASAIGIKTKAGILDALILNSDGSLNPDADLVLFQCWSTCHNRIKQFDPRTGCVDFTRPLGRYYLGQSNRFYIENTRACLDQPGEWFLDKIGKQILYIPKENEDLTKSQVILSFVPQTLIRIDGNTDGQVGKTVDHVNFHGLTFEHTDADLSPVYAHSVQGCDTQRGAFDATGWHNSTISNCTFTHIGENGINLMAGCQHNTVTRNYFEDLGAGGVYLPDKPQQPVSDGSVTAYNKIDNNLITDGGRIFHAACGVFLAGLASWNQITHNDISNFTWTGIHLGWSWSSEAKTWTHHNEVGYNHIHDIGNGVLSDLAGIYMLGVSTGTFLHHNKIHDITRYDDGYGGWGIYFDAGSSEITVENNVVYRTCDGGLHLHNYDYPYGDKITNNVFGVSDHGSIIRNAAHNTTKHPYHARLTKNIIFNTSPALLTGEFRGAQQKVELENNCYWSFGDAPIEFPETDSTNIHDVDISIPERNTVALSYWQQKSGRDQGSIVADPCFVDWLHDDYRLTTQSPARKIGIKSIDTIDQAGLYGNDAWTSRASRIVPRTKEYCDLQKLAHEYHDGFEEYASGDHPDNFSCFNGGGKTSGIVVSNEQAAEGKYSLKITDESGLRWVHDPNFALMQKFDSGQIVQKFQLYTDMHPINIVFEWRDYGGGQYKTGPAFNVVQSIKGKSGCTVFCQGQKLMEIPDKTWVQFIVECPNAAPRASRNKEQNDRNDMMKRSQADNSETVQSPVKTTSAARNWTLAVKIPGQPVQQFGPFDGLPEAYYSVNWMGVISMSNESATFFVDDWNVQVKK